MTKTEIMKVLAQWATPTLLALCVFFIKRWLDRVERAIKELSREVNSLKTKQAVSSEREANIRGNLESLASSIKGTDKTVGKLSSSVEKVWLVLQNSEIVKSRMSDFGGNR